MTKRKGKAHLLKILPEYFEAVRQGKKNFEIRKNDRDFQVDDLLVLCEWNPKQQDFTGRQSRRRVTYIAHGPIYGLEAGYSVLGMKRLTITR